jgi:predicted transcriptional regulator
MRGRKPSPGLTDAELRVMDALWQQAPATVSEVAERIDGPSRPAYTTVLTMLRILERKGYVRHEKDGRRFTYAPLVDRRQARRSALSQLLGRFFGGSEALLVNDLLGHEETDPEQLDRLRTLLDTARPSRGKGGAR